ncbi:MAG: cell division protein SepF [Oscillospiraceae bacterium]|nr:cell division protein SepF [Oscillospiraceae bacterium]
MSFWDNVKKFAQPYSDEDYDDDYEDDLEGFEEPQEAAPRRRRPSPFASDDSVEAGVSAASAPQSTAASSAFSGQVLNMSTGNKQEVVLFHAKSFDDAAKAADELCKKKAVILNMENVDKALTRRVVDFLSGSVYALNGTVKKIAQSTYLFCPHNMSITGDLENIQAEVESYL